MILPVFQALTNLYFAPGQAVWDRQYGFQLAKEKVSTSYIVLSQTIVMSINSSNL